MMLRQVAVTCVHEGRLRTLCSVILRHMGYEVREAQDVAQAKTMMDAQSTAVLIVGRSEADNEELKKFCADGRLKYIFVAPEERIESLLVLLEQRATPRP